MMFYVIDADNLTSYSADRDASESFETHKMAEERAIELAESEPGKLFQIVATIAEVMCPIGKPQVTPVKSK